MDNGIQFIIPQLIFCLEQAVKQKSHLVYFKSIAVDPLVWTIVAAQIENYTVQIFYKWPVVGTQFSSQNE